ncbi:MAG: hypothetical protein PHN38_04870 [Sulfurospirillaceae bacterium]|nr:hypothetical protein [Sulfurospirillaceae bacterium]MDD3462518.1 hypothetical protein [Sulfurospirillaceae bacterium]
MEINNVQICNVCLRPSDKDTSAVYVKAIAKGEEVHVCTSCIPHIIHGSGDIIKSNTTVLQEYSK